MRPPAARASALPLIGRQRDARSACARRGSARCAGARQIVWVAGEAGRRQDHADRQLRRRSSAGVPVAHGQCVEQFGAGEPYLPVLEALGALCRNDPALPPLLRAVAPTWLLQLPWLSSEAERDALQRELAGASQDRMLRELGELLDRYTRDAAAAAGDRRPALERPRHACA